MGSKLAVRENVPIVGICAIAFALLGIYSGKPFFSIIFVLLSIILSIIALCKGQVNLGLSVFGIHLVVMVSRIASFVINGKTMVEAIIELFLSFS